MERWLNVLLAKPKMDKLIKAETKYIRTSPRKLRLIADAVRSLKPSQAIERLQFVNKRAAEALNKTIKSAIANAVNNFKLKAENLTFKEIKINEGPTLKRWQAASRGRAHRILKRTSHIIVTLQAKVEAENGTKS